MAALLIARARLALFQQAIALRAHASLRARDTDGARVFTKQPLEDLESL
jgi:hypothetical protein